MPYLKIIAILLCVLIAPFTSQAIAQDDMAYTPEPLSITADGAYAFATLPGSPTGAAFMILKNTGENEDTLIEARSAVAEITEIHENLVDPDDGTMMMRKIKSIKIPAKGSVTLEPKGLHIMFIKLKEPLTLGSDFPITLVFEKLGEVVVPISIVPPGRSIEKPIPKSSNNFDLNDLYDPLGTAQKKIKN